MQKHMRTFVLVLLAVVWLSLPMQGFASEEEQEVSTNSTENSENEELSTVALMVEGALLTPEVPPRIVDGRTMVPLRVILENLGAEVAWFPETKEIQIENSDKDKLISLTLNKKHAVVNGVGAMLDVAPYVQDGRTMVPIRYISEWMGANVGWDAENRTVIITAPIELAAGMPEDEEDAEREDSSKEGQEEQESGPGPLLIHGEPYLPLDALASVFDFEYEWTDPFVVSLQGEALQTEWIKLAEERERKKKIGELPDDVLVELPDPVPSSENTEGKTAWYDDREDKLFLRALTKEIKDEVPEWKQVSRVVNETFYIPPSVLQRTFHVQVSWDEEARRVTFQSFNWVEDIEVDDDAVTIEMDGEEAYEAQSFYLPDPDRFVIDVPNAMLNEELFNRWEEEFSEGEWEHPHIKQVRFSQFSYRPSVVRIVLDLKEPRMFTLEQGRRDIALEPSDLIPQKKWTVVIDAGHGGKDPGALGKISREKNVNLSVAQKVIRYLEEEEDIRVIATRTTDTFISLEERTQIANRNEADLFVSIHSNAFPNKPQISGTETFYLTDDGLVFAKIVHAHLLEATGFNDRGLRTARFYVLRNTTMPAVLLELGYMTNAAEEKRLNDPELQEQIARAIVQSIKEYREELEK